MDPSGFDNDIFIDLVKKRPCLWNTTIPDYHDKVKKRNAWVEVCSDMYPGFTDKSEKEQNDLGGKIMKKWKNFRDSYLRSVKKKTVSGQGAQNRAYVYSRQLEFLLSSSTPSPTATSLDEEIPSIEEDADDPDHDAGPIIVSPRDSGSAEPVLDHQVSGPSSRPDLPPTTSPPATASASKRGASSFAKMPANKRRLIVEENLLNFMKTPEPTITVQQPQQDPDDDKSFFDSLLPIVKTLPMDSKIDFRVRVMGMLRELRAAPNIRSFQNLQTFPHSHMSQQTAPTISFTPQIIHQQEHQRHHHPVGLQPSLQQPLQFTEIPQNPYPTTQRQTPFEWEAGSSNTFTPPAESNMD